MQTLQWHPQGLECIFRGSNQTISAPQALLIWLFYLSVSPIIQMFNLKCHFLYKTLIYLPSAKFNLISSLVIFLFCIKFMFTPGDFGQNSWACLFIFLKMMCSFDLKHHHHMTFSRGGVHTCLLASAMEPATGRMTPVTSSLGKQWVHCPYLQNTMGGYLEEHG